MQSVSRRLEELHSRFSACNSSSRTSSPSKNCNRCALSSSPFPEGGSEHPPLHQPPDSPPHGYSTILTNCKPPKPPEPTHFHWNSSLRRNNTSSRRNHCRAPIFTRGAGGRDGQRPYTSVITTDSQHINSQRRQIIILEIINFKIAAVKLTTTRRTQEVQTSASSSQNCCPE